MKEYEIISKYFKPLTNSFSGALDLSDDVAIFPKNDKIDYVITTDSILEGAHFIENSMPETIAHRLIVSNLSDIASAGATPKFITLNGSISSKTDEAWLKSFANKIAELQKEYGFHLLGGDTIKSEDKLYFSATIIGEVDSGKALIRRNAKGSDDIYVSGKIGDAYMGLKVLLGSFEDIGKQEKNYFINKYTSPTARISLGEKLIGFANSATDISDGLIIDLQNICDSSNLSAEIKKDAIPLSIEDEKLFENLVSGGDDYELIFTARKDFRKEISKIAKSLNLEISLIGKMINSDAENKITILDGNNKEYHVTNQGYQHEI